jgi:putative addiction module component, TIGR02574 family
MSVKAEKLLEEALKLPQNTRANLAGRLILSLDEEDDKGVEAEWSAELDRRLDNFDVSRAQALPWAKVRRNVLRSRRGRK